MGRPVRLCFIILPFVLACLMLGGCGGNTSAGDGQEGDGALIKPPPAGKALSAEDPLPQCNLIVNDSWRVGACQVYNEGRYLHVIFGTEGTWTLTDVRVYADTVPPAGEPEYQHDPPMPAAPAQAPAGAPLGDDTVALNVTGHDGTTGAPPYFVQPLPYEREQLDGRDSLQLVFDIGKLAPGGTIYFMADAGVKEYVTSTNIHTANVRSPAAPGENVIEYHVPPALNLPTGEFSGYVSYAANSTYRASLMDCPPGYDVEPNTFYPAWCVDLEHHIIPGHIYTFELYNSCDPDLPAALRDDDWDMVNYVLNHKVGYHDEVQRAIWYFVGGGGYPTHPDAVAMVEDALQNGEGFVPGLNEHVAVVMYPGPDVQVTAFELELKPAPFE